MAIHLPDMVQSVLEENVNGNLFDLAKKRTAWLWKWAKRAGELEKEEHLSKESMPEHLRVLLGNERLLLMREMLEECEYPDKDLVKDITWGFNLTGWSSSSGVFPRQVKRPQYDVATLKTLAEGLSKAICLQLQAVGDNDVVNQTTWSRTLEELERGYIWQDDSPDASSRVLAKRFGLVQKDKIRTKDDCSIGGLNKTIGVVEKHRIHSIDEISAMLAWMLDFHKKEREASLSDLGSYI